MITGDTVAAIATAPGVGAVSLIRVSGPDAISLSAKALRCKGGLESQPERYAVLGKVLNADGDVVDEVLATVFQGPRSFTGEDVVEFACHGGVLVTRRVLERLLECGARSADPGEFSRRAFENGKLDLTQAEAIMDLISAQTDMAMRAAHEQLQGKLGDQSEALRETLLGVVAHVEAYIDFPDEDIDPDTGAAMLKRVDDVQLGIQKMLSTAEQGRILREGVRTVICGEPNVGKSSLLNGLLGYERAIVSDIEGTTRDTVEEVINVKGIPVRLIDTAGVRESTDQIEQQGIVRSEKQIELADLILEVVDGSKPGQRLLTEEQINGRHHLLVVNKTDLGQDNVWGGAGGVQISCLDENGLDGLADAISDELLLSESTWGGHAMAINARHQDCLKKAGEFLSHARESLVLNTGIEFASIDLREALNSIGEIAGRVDTEEILGEIFGSFCIGK
ncbi:tRNA uridine-5-carboxymethylaminomethyl(34) synthesis GTPase MnmE [Rubritalea profundi]|uniref:tRNA modification GTPase MnmE n=1 Tax=Rubritalea profundi TaxID=1658618 RepID=A0A2S7TY92_9BACT|nr:tRNA uridine-5-carboxymethylaminomethyl(34) synthesis GTPase MnmE [Rubritalea profundi]PQJ27094.1 tRNA uridine-5-carboxymethylaminomethyl(34) synthesis GTPase MnmE [Rubritalea profundi]